MNMLQCLLLWMCYNKCTSTHSALLNLDEKYLLHVYFEYRFRLTYRLILREKELHFNIGVYNPSKDLTFSFNLLLHTYFKVPDVRRCQITGLHGCTFIDKVCTTQTRTWRSASTCYCTCTSNPWTYAGVRDWEDVINSADKPNHNVKRFFHSSGVIRCLPVLGFVDLPLLELVSPFLESIHNSSQLPQVSYNHIINCAELVGLPDHETLQLYTELAYSIQPSDSNSLIWGYLWSTTEGDPNPYSKIVLWITLVTAHQPWQYKIQYQK